MKSRRAVAIKEKQFLNCKRKSDVKFLELIMYPGKEGEMNMFIIQIWFNLECNIKNYII